MEKESSLIILSGKSNWPSRGADTGQPSGVGGGGVDYQGWSVERQAQLAVAWRPEEQFIQNQNQVRARGGGGEEEEEDN